MSIKVNELVNKEWEKAEVRQRIVDYNGNDGLHYDCEEDSIVDNVVENVIERYRDRSAVGIKKYGTTLQRNNLSTLEWVNHAQEEAMDFVLYLEKLRDGLIISGK
jgi:hypothetical protein